MMDSCAVEGIGLTPSEGVSHAVFPNPGGRSNAMKGAVAREPSRFRQRGYDARGSRRISLLDRPIAGNSEAQPLRRYLSR